MQSDSYVYIHTHIYTKQSDSYIYMFFFRFFSTIGYYKILKRVAMNIGSIYLFKLEFSSFLHLCSEVGLLDYIINYDSVFVQKKHRIWEIRILKTSSVSSPFILHKKNLNRSKVTLHVNRCLFLSKLKFQASQHFSNWHDIQDLHFLQCFLNVLLIRSSLNMQNPDSHPKIQMCFDCWSVHWECFCHDLGLSLLLMLLKDCIYFLFFPALSRYNWQKKSLVFWAHFSILYNFSTITENSSVVVT